MPLVDALNVAKYHSVTALSQLLRHGQTGLLGGDPWLLRGQCDPGVVLLDKVELHGEFLLSARVGRRGKK